MSDTPQLSELEVRLCESDAFRRSQVFALSDALAAANGELAVLRSRIAKLEADLKPKDPA